jgi:hypothetical protein
MADGPYGLLVVGSKNGKRGRALFVGLDDQTKVYTTGVNDRPPLLAAVCGAGKEAWAASAGSVVRFDKGMAVAEKLESDGVPVAMALDMVGVPWLVTDRCALRRHVEANEGIWKVYYRRDANRPPLVGIGFTPDGATLLDAKGGIVEVEPHDVTAWRKT